MPKFELPKELPSAQIADILALSDSLWIMPADLPTVKETRQQLFAELSAAVVPAVWDVWRHEVPAAREKAVVRQIGRGIRQAFDTLRSKNFEAPQFELWRIPRYWEPPIAPTEPEDLPRHLLQLYRLTAAFIALSIRNNLEDIHARYTSDEHMPQLNRAVRNAVYGVLLAHPGHTWNLSLPAKVFIQGAMMKMYDRELPPVVGE